MQSTRAPAYRRRAPEPVSAERDAWYARPPHDVLSAQTFLDSRLSVAAVSPEKALMYAVLEDAFLCLQKAGDPTPRVQRQAWEAAQWFNSEESRWVFSFLPICEALGLDARYVRKKLRDWHPAALDMAQAKR